MNQNELKEVALKTSEFINEVKTSKNFSNEPFTHFFIDNLIY